jgi:hypothetical protein
LETLQLEFEHTNRINNGELKCSPLFQKNCRGGIAMAEYNIKNQIENLNSKDQKLYFEIRNIMSEWDPLYLLANGAPSDEYHSETVNILKILKIDGGTHEIENFLSKFFTENLKNNKKSFIKTSKKISQKIIDLIKRGG